MAGACALGACWDEPARAPLSPCSRRLAHAPRCLCRRRNLARLPPDLLWLEYAVRQPRGPTPAAEAGASTAATSTAGGAGTDLEARRPSLSERRPYVVYRWNLLAHLGQVSSFAVRPGRSGWPGCYAPMARASSLRTEEKFQGRCGRTDLSPCLRASQQVCCGGCHHEHACQPACGALTVCR